MTKRFCDGKVPAPAANALDGAEEKELWNVVQGAVASVRKGIDEMRLDLSLAQVIAAVKAINRYFELKQPWTLAKQADKGPLHTTLYLAAESLRVAAQLLQPVMPAKMEQLRSALGLRGPCTWPELLEFGKLPPGREVKEEGPLFPRIEAPAAAPAPAPAVEGVITYDEFAKVQFKTARVLEAVKVEGADKLLRLQIDVGGEKRQIVAGIAQSYAPETLIGKTIVVVANLKPAKIRGVESNGMLLAAHSGGRLHVVTVDGDVESGSGVK
ncbi:MAG TPA: methionine--tRNA ligase subunit beta [Kiritimatiellia bacterium]